MGTSEAFHPLLSHTDLKCLRRAASIRQQADDCPNASPQAPAALHDVMTSDANWKPKSWSSKKYPMSNLDIGRTKAKILGQLWTAIRYLPFFREKHAQVHAT